METFYAECSCPAPTIYVFGTKCPKCGCYANRNPQFLEGKKQIKANMDTIWAAAPNVDPSKK